MTKPDDDDDLSRFFEVMDKLAGNVKADGSPAVEPKPQKPLRQIDETLIAELLLSEDSSERVKGRLLASQAGEEMQKYVADECERGTPIDEVLMAMVEVTAIHVGSLIVGNDIVPVPAAKGLVRVFGSYLYRIVTMNRPA